MNLIVTTEYLGNKEGTISRIYDGKETPKTELGCKNLSDKILEKMQYQRELLLQDTTVYKITGFI